MTALTRTWAVLMTLTAFSLWAGRAGGDGSLGLLGAGLVLAAANFKADQILTHFLDLRRAGPGWRTLFRVMLTLLGAAIFGIHAIAPMIAAA
ncbi:cytochrome C oxidase subunit IV family protein [Roseomonas genomospecies 6]|uniref:Thiosulfate reductase n=1 Tax=Roseomonas genomospecies 6 TaxID=214106 RepID=A0A9W7NJP7_9PROT|nr:cytochrome C oxidase subunit IV family protein [Roseomonas genomospecies 6]KAA0680714.1 hypothetical protein DS843_12830 [Roseomonas genomospecies 6]